MGDLGRMLLFFGVILVIAGLVVMLFGRMNLPLGRLPGDIVYRGKTRFFIFRLSPQSCSALCCRECCT